MWKTLVDKPVESVENFELSTVILILFKNPALWKDWFPGLHNTRISS